MNVLKKKKKNVRNSFQKVLAKFKNRLAETLSGYTIRVCRNYLEVYRYKTTYLTLGLIT